MIRKYELLVVISLFCIGLFSFKLVYGLAGSLDNLQNQLSAETGYRAELEGYLALHNITIPPILGLDSLNTPFLEKFVKENMADCQSGKHDIQVADLKSNPYMTEAELTEQLKMYGDC